MFKLKKDYNFEIYHPEIFNFVDMGLATCHSKGIDHIKDQFNFVKRMVKNAKERVDKGYCSWDVQDMNDYLGYLIPAMLRDYKKNHFGSPSRLGVNKPNEYGILVNEGGAEAWNEILDKMIFLFEEADEHTCRKFNAYEEDYHKASSEFRDKYGAFGQKLQTDEEKENQKRTGGITLHSMDEIPEYKEIYNKYHEREDEIAQYRKACRTEAFRMLVEYYDDLWC